MKFRRIAAIFLLASSGPVAASLVGGCSVLEKLRGGEADAAPSVSASAPSASVAATETASAPTEEPLASASGAPTARIAPKTDGGIADAGAKTDGATGILMPIPPGFSAIPSTIVIPSTMPKLPPLPSGILLPRLPASAKLPGAK
jgi:hypothetical protein